MQKDYDIIIVGGGIVGLTLAMALGKSNKSLSIALFEAKDNDSNWDKDHYSPRVSALSLASKNIFESLDVWRALASYRVSPFEKMYVWDDATKNAIDFNSEDIAKKELGFIVENNLIVKILKDKLKSVHNVTLLCPIKVINFSEEKNNIVLKTSDDNEFHAKLVIAADGANSQLRNLANIDLDFHDYNEEAIVATVETTVSHAKIARQVFLANGPLAFLPLSDSHHCSIVWSVAKDEAEKLMHLSDTNFINELTNVFSHQVGEIVNIDKRFKFPLYKQKAGQYLKGRIVLVGDAAHVVHPLAGQGLNMGLLDAATLEEVISTAIKKEYDFSHYQHLRRYERWRKSQNNRLWYGIDGIKTLLCNDKKSIKRLSAIGLNFINRLPWIKNKLVREAVGIHNDLPRIAKV